MKFPNKFRIVWWAILLATGPLLLFPRYPAFARGASTPIDALIFLVWVALLLVPIFSEFSVAGMTFKQQIEALKTEVVQKIAEFKNDVRAEVRATVSPTFHINPQPLPDTALDTLKKQIDEIVSAKGATSISPENARAPKAPFEAQLLFEARYALEVELRRIARAHQLGRDRAPTMQILRQMVASGLVDERLEHVLREVYLICSPAIHGEKVSKAQVAFVDDVLPELLATLKLID